MNWRERGVDTLLAFAVVAVVSVVIGAIETSTHISNISNLYILGIAGLAARRGRYPAIVASVLAFLTFDWFFIPPVHVFTVDDPSEYLALLTLLATGILIGQLLTLVRQRAREAQARQRQTQLLYEVSHAALTSPAIEDVYQLALERLNQTLGLAWSRLLVRGQQSTLSLVASLGEAPDLPDEPQWLQRVLEEGQVLAVCRLPQKNVRVVTDVDAAVGKSLTPEGGQVCQVYIPLQIESRVEGVLVVGEKTTGQYGTVDDHDLLLAYSNQLAIAVQRDQLADQQARARAVEESDRLKSALVSSVSHELKTPLAAIKASATSLMDGAGTSEPVRRELADSINRETDRLTKLVSNLLDMSRLEAGALQPKLEWTSIADVIADVMDRLDPVVEGRRIEVQVPESLPATPLDFVLISQVITNLLDNALRYSPRDAAIRISAEVAREQLRVTVFNEGSHIPMDQIDRLFDKFYRLSTATGGTGLGLAIVRGIIEAHHGKIWAENIGRRGVAFMFTLPSPPADPATANMAAFEEQVSKRQAESGG